MLEYAKLGFGLGFQPARTALYYAQRVVVHPAFRSAITNGIAALINRRHPPSGLDEPASAGEDSRDILSTLANDGFAMLGALLSADKIAEMRSYLADKPLALRGGGLVVRDNVPPSCTIADYTLDTVLHCPHVIEFANTGLILRTAVQYLKCLPTISSIGIRWSFPGNQAQASTQGFHRDPDDWKFFKLFAYLTDVDETCGPHLFVRGSHKTSGTIFARPITFEEFDRDFGRDLICPVTGPSGTTFIADTHGVHAGPVPSSKPRLMLEVGYSLLPVFAFQYQPVALADKPDVNAYVNRLLLKD